MLKNPRETRHCSSARLGSGREVIKDLKQEMVLIWIFKNELFIELIGQGRTFQGKAKATCKSIGPGQGKVQSVALNGCGASGEK